MITRCHGRRGAATCQAITFFQTCQTKRQPVFGLLSVNRESMVGSENLQNRGRVSGHDCLKHDGKTLVNTCLTIHRFALRRSVLYLALSLFLATRTLVSLVPDAATTLKQKYYGGRVKNAIPLLPTGSNAYASGNNETA